MRAFRRFFAVIMAVLLLAGCGRNADPDVPDGLTREEAALFTAVARVCPRGENRSKAEYLTFQIENWSFDALPDAVAAYLEEYCVNGGARLVQLGFEELREQGLIVKGDGGFYGTDEDTYALGKGRIVTFTRSGNPEQDELTVRVRSYISDNDQSGYDIILKYDKNAWQVVRLANAWGRAYMNTDAPDDAATGSPAK